jgi:tetratricopeptide (TPR) repeat protein
LGAFRLVFNASALLLALGLAWAAGTAALQVQALPWQDLALGRLLAEAGSFPPSEALLFTASQRAFDGLAWGWDLLAAQLFRAGGEGLLRGLDAAALGLAVISLAAAGFRRGARPFSTALFCAAAVLAARPDLTPGPGLLAWALFCAALWLMEGPLNSALLDRWIWLPPLALLAVNLHAAAWALLPLAGLWLILEGGPQPSRLAKLGVFGVLLLCLCLHPQGPWAQAQDWRALAPSPLWPGAFAVRQGALLLLALAVLLLFAAAWTPQPGPSQARDRVLLLGFGALGLLSRDALPWALAVAAPLAAQRFDQVVDALPAALRALRWPLKVLLLAGALFSAWHQGLRWPEPRPQAYPRQSLAFYEEELLDLRILCPPDWTGWLASRLAPHARFALDARGRADSAAAIALNGALRGEGQVLESLKSHGVEAAWLPLGSPLAVQLAQAQGWQPVSVDDNSVLYVRELPQLAELIHTHAPRGLRLGDPERPFDASRVAEAEADLETRLARDPKLGVLYLFQAELWLAKGHEAKARETLEAGIRADPDFAGTYARLAALRAQRGERSEARQLYERALRRQERADWRDALQALGAP